jgi:hypothetical protein
VTLRRPGPVSIEKALGFLPLVVGDLEKLEAGLAAEAGKASDGTVEKLLEGLQGNLRFARQLICLCAVAPRFTEELDPKAPELRSIEDLDFADFWFLFTQLLRLSGVTQLQELVRPISPTGSASSPTTPSAGDMEDVPPASSAVN